MVPAQEGQLGADPLAEAGGDGEAPAAAAGAPGGEGRKEPGGRTTGMEHRKADPRCPLCKLWGLPWDPNDPSTHGKQHIHAEAIWRLWDPTDKVKNWPEKVAAEAAKLGAEVTVKQVKQHFANHRIEQPMYSGRLQTESMIERLLDAPPRTRAIIEGVYRQRVLLQRQIHEIYFLPELSEQSARKMHKTELKALAQEHFLYRYFPSAEDAKLPGADQLPRFSQQTLWFLGKVAVPYIQHRYGLTFTPPYINRARDVSKHTLIHDIQANDVAVKLAEALRTQQESGPLATAAGQLKAEFRRENWYGPGPLMLAMGFWDRRRQEQMRLQPDGFASLAVHPLDGAVLPATQLPFFYEFDHGTKDTVDVARQLLAYHSLGRSGAATERFPELKASGYSPPLLMVFSNKRKNKRRLELVAQRMRNIWREEYGGEEPACQILLVYEEDWRKNPLAPAVGVDAWDDDERPTPFLEWLIRASRPLYEQAAIAPNQVLKLDPKAAPVKAEGAMSPEGMKKAQEALARRRAERAAQAEAKKGAQEEKLPSERPAAADGGELPQKEALPPEAEPSPPSEEAGAPMTPGADQGAGEALEGLLGDEQGAEPAGEGPQAQDAGSRAEVAHEGGEARADDEVERMRRELAEARERIAELERRLTQPQAREVEPGPDAEEARPDEPQLPEAEDAEVQELAAEEAAESKEAAAGGDDQEEFAPAPFAPPELEGLLNTSPADSWALEEGDDEPLADEGEAEPAEPHEEGEEELEPVEEGAQGFEEAPEGGEEGGGAPDESDTEPAAKDEDAGGKGALPDFDAAMRAAAGTPPAPQPAPPSYYPSPEPPTPPAPAPMLHAPQPVPTPTPPSGRTEPSPFPDLEGPEPADHAEPAPGPAAAPADGPLSQAAPPDGPEIPPKPSGGESIAEQEAPATPAAPQPALPEEQAARPAPAPAPQPAPAPDIPVRTPDHGPAEAPAPPQAPEITPPAPAPQPAPPAHSPAVAPTAPEADPESASPEPAASVPQPPAATSAPASPAPPPAAAPAPTSEAAFQPAPPAQPAPSPQPTPAPAQARAPQPESSPAPAPQPTPPAAPPAAPPGAAEAPATDALGGGPGDPDLSIQERLDRQAAARRRARRRRRH